MRFLKSLVGRHGPYELLEAWAIVGLTLAAVLLMAASVYAFGSG